MLDSLLHVLMGRGCVDGCIGILARFLLFNDPDEMLWDRVVL